VAAECRRRLLCALGYRSTDLLPRVLVGSLASAPWAATRLSGPKDRH